MNKPQGEGYFSVLGSLNYCNEAVFLDGETLGLATTHHEGDLAYDLHETISEAGGHVTGDAALYL